MFYYLSLLLTPYVSAFNIFSYHTVRAGGAAFTGFIFCVLIGPRVIEWLQALKVGQVIKKDHVADLHALHKGKAGTPTMGGVLIILNTLFSLLLWTTLTNRLLVLITVVFCMLGFVGFVDDFLKLRRKHNDGLTARAKIIGQVAAGLFLGLALYFSPITVGSSYLKLDHVLDWPSLTDDFQRAVNDGSVTAQRCVWDRLSAPLQRRLLSTPVDSQLDGRSKRLLVAELNAVLGEPDLYNAAAWKNTPPNGESHELMDKGLDNLTERELTRFNRLLVEAAFPGVIAKGAKNLHTKVEIPGLKGTLIPLGPLYILLVILIIVCTSNAVNLTDGLDGLAAGASVISLLTFTGIAYVVSRIDWSEYLYLIYVPEASELAVFGAAVLGTTLGFLWFNAHPAEVFMGDTGSLALGGVIGTMAVLTKQELLLPVVAGLFVLEGMSVVLQVGSFKLTGKRVFRMAPLHHHFELKGWSETKVTIRFWILAGLFALLSLATLKLR